MTTLFDLAAQRARARKVFGLPELTDPVAIDAEAWDATARLMLGDLRNWAPTGFVQALGADEIEHLMDEDPDDREIRKAHGFTRDDDWEDESLLCRFGCGLSYPDIASGKIRKCRGRLCGREIRFVTPLGDPGSEPCDEPAGHEGDCDSSQLGARIMRILDAS